MSPGYETHVYGCMRVCVCVQGGQQTFLCPARRRAPGAPQGLTPASSVDRHAVFPVHNTSDGLRSQTQTGSASAPQTLVTGE